MTNPERDQADQDTRMKSAQLEKLELENEKLRLDLERMKTGKRGLESFIPYLPLITVLITIAGFAFGIYQYRAQQLANREAQAAQSEKDRVARETQSQKDTEAGQREFMKPVLQTQLSLYLEASSAAATIISSTDASEKTKAANDFWRLYHGPLVLVESKAVSDAMVNFGRCLNQREMCDEGELNDRVLRLTSRMQESILASWNAKPENFAANTFTYR